MLKKSIVLFFCLCNITIVFSQHKKNAEYLNDFKNCFTDSCRGWYYLYLGKKYDGNNNPLALKYFDTSISYFNIAKLKRDEINVIMRQGNLYRKMNNEAKALEANKIAYDYFIKQPNNEDFMWLIYHQYAIIYYERNDLVQSHKYCKKALAAVKNKKLYKREGISFNQLGLINKKKGQYKEAIYYLSKSVEIKKKDPQYVPADNVKPQNNIAKIYRDLGDFKKAEELLLNSWRIANKIDDNELLQMCYMDLASTHLSMDKINLALKNHIKAEEYAIKINSPKLIAESKIGIAICYKKQSKFSKSYDYLNQAIEITEHYNSKKDLSNIYSTISSLFFELNEISKAKTYVEKAISIDIENNESEKNYFNYSILGSILFELNNVKEAKRYFQESIKTGTDLNKFNKLSGINFLYAQGLYNNKLYNEAIAIVKTSIEQAKKYGLNNDFVSSNGLLAQIFLKTENYKFADSFINIALFNIKNVQDPLVVKNIYEIKSQILEKNNNLKEALKYLRESKKIEDSIFNAQKLNEIYNAETKYQTKEKEKALAAKTKEAELANIKNQKIVSYAKYLGLSVLILGFIAFFTYNYQKQKKKLAFKEIETLKQENEIKELHGVLAGQEIERARIAQELHDGMGGLLAGSKLLIAKAMEDVPEIKNSKAFNMGVENLECATSELKQISLNLLPKVLSKMGLQNALQDYCDTINQAAKIKIDYINTNFFCKLHQDSELIIYRIIQELINNVLKHAEAKNILFEISERNQQLLISFSDDGKGFNTDCISVSKGLGFNSIKNRLKMLNGKFAIQSTAKQGTQIEINIPILEHSV